MKKIIIILIIGGIFMTVHGFCDNKCKHEVYTKDNDNTMSVDFAQKGGATITRRGNVVTVYAEMELEPTEAKTLGNYATLPDWAIPSSSINPNSEYKTFRSAVGTDMNLVAVGYIMVRPELKQISFVANNTDELNTVSLMMTFSYIVD